MFFDPTKHSLLAVNYFWTTLWPLIQWKYKQHFRPTMLLEGHHSISFFPCVIFQFRVQSYWLYCVNDLFAILISGTEIKAKFDNYLFVPTTHVVTMHFSLFYVYFTVDKYEFHQNWIFNCVTQFVNRPVNLWDSCARFSFVIHLFAVACQVIPSHGNPLMRQTLSDGTIFKYCSIKYQTFHQVSEKTSQKTYLHQKTTWKAFQMPQRAIKHKLTCPIELTSGSVLIGRRGILAIPRNRLVYAQTELLYNCPRSLKHSVNNILHKINLTFHTDLGKSKFLSPLITLFSVSWLLFQFTLFF